MSAYAPMAQWRLVRRPVGEPTTDDVELVEVSLPPLDEGELLVRNTFLSVDPYMRGRMNDVPSYVPPFPLGGPMDGGAVGVVESVSGDVTDRSGRAVHRGDTVLHDAGWRTHALLPGRAVRVVDTKAAPPQSYLGILGMPGLTAYAGLLRVGEFRSGDRVFVSAAAGAVGSLAGQLARLKGASLVVGSAGGPEKMRWLLDDAGFDRAIDYKAGPLRAALKNEAPEGIDVYFDNVGGDHLEAAIWSLRQGGRVAMCGAVSHVQRHRGRRRAAQPVAGDREAAHAARVHRHRPPRPAAPVRGGGRRPGSGRPDRVARDGRRGDRAHLRRVPRRCCPAATPARCSSASSRAQRPGSETVERALAALGYTSNRAWRGGWRRPLR